MTKTKTKTLLDDPNQGLYLRLEPNGLTYIMHQCARQGGGYWHFLIRTKCHWCDKPFPENYIALRDFNNMGNEDTGYVGREPWDSPPYKS